MYYAVKRGRVSGIYLNWKDCEKQVTGFPDAKFKKFNTLKEAEDYLLNVEDMVTNYPTTGLAVDASLLKKNTSGEYQIFDIEKKEIIFKSNVYEESTINIMEFLAIVKAIEISQSNFLYKDCNIYSDSFTALTWVMNRKIKTKQQTNQVLNKLLQDALEFLNNIQVTNTLLKWDTRKLGEIPADYNRK